MTKFTNFQEAGAFLQAKKADSANKSIFQCVVDYLRVKKSAQMEDIVRALEGQSFDTDEVSQSVLFMRNSGELNCTRATPHLYSLSDPTMFYYEPKKVEAKKSRRFKIKEEIDFLPKSNYAKGTPVKERDLNAIKALLGKLPEVAPTDTILEALYKLLSDFQWRSIDDIVLLFKEANHPAKESSIRVAVSAMDKDFRNYLFEVEKDKRKENSLGKKMTTTFYKRRMTDKTLSFDEAKDSFANSRENPTSIDGSSLFEFNVKIKGVSLTMRELGQFLSAVEGLHEVDPRKKDLFQIREVIEFKGMLLMPDEVNEIFKAYKHFLFS